MAIFSSEKCPNCGAAIKKKAKFCASCGEQVAQATFKCGKCGAEIPGGAKFCPSCGEDAPGASPKADAPEEAGTSAHRRWVRQGGDFAARIDITDLPGVFRRGVDIEAGTRALLLQNGRFLEELPEGQYKLDQDKGLIRRLLEKFVPTDPVTVIVMDAGDVVLPFAVSGLLTQENLAVDLQTTAVVRLSSPENFFVNCMKSQTAVRTDDLRLQLSEEAKLVVQSTVKSEAAEQLYGNLELRRKMEADLTENMRRSLARYGLELLQVRKMEFSSEELEDLAKGRGEIAIYRKQAEIELDRERTGISIEQQQAEIYGLRLDLLKEKADLRDRADAIMTEKKMRELNRKEDFEAFVQENDTKEILRKEEKQDLVLLLEQRREDRQLARHHFLQKLQGEYYIERMRQLRQIEVADNELELEKLESNIKRERRALDAELEKQWTGRQHERKMAEDKLDERVTGERVLKEHELALRDLDFNQNMKERTAELQVKLEERIKEHDEDMKEAMDGIELLDAMKSRKQDRLRRSWEDRRKHLEEMNRIELDMEERARRLAREDELERQREKREDDIARQKAEVEAKEKILAAKSAASIEALLSEAGASEAQQILKLEELRAQQGMTPEQMLAMASDQSPAAAQALGKHYEQQGMANERVMEFMEKAHQKEVEGMEARLQAEAARVEDQKGFREELSSTQDKAARSIQEAAERAVDTMGQVAKTQAENLRPTQTIVGAGGGMMGGMVVGAGGMDAGVGFGSICPHCNVQHPINTKFCPNTGKEIRGVEKVMVCPKCGAECEHGARFCHECRSELKGGGD